MPLLLPAPELQFADANGHPYAGGTVAFYIWGTDTPKDTWADKDGTVLNTNPVILDAAGRAIIFGDGEYRCVLRDVDGNLIYDQWTSSVISDAMMPVVQAATIADARDLLGVTDTVQTETDRALAAESTLTNNITTLTGDLNAEIARAEAAENKLNGQLGGGAFQSGIAQTNSSGYAGVTFPSAYTTLDNPFVMTNVWYGSLVAVTIAVETTPTGFTAWAADPSGNPVGIGFLWMSYGTPP